MNYQDIIICLPRDEVQARFATLNPGATTFETEFVEWMTHACNLETTRPAAELLNDIYTAVVRMVEFNRDPEFTEMVRKILPFFLDALVNDQVASAFIRTTIQKMDETLAFIKAAMAAPKKEEQPIVEGEVFPGLADFLLARHKEFSTKVERVIHLNSDDGPYDLALVSGSGLGLQWHNFFGPAMPGPWIRPYTWRDLVDTDDVRPDMWSIRDDGGSNVVYHKRRPEFFQACNVRMDEVRGEYLSMFGLEGFSDSDLIDSIILDLLKRDLNREWVGQPNLGNMHGSSLYLQTVGEILGIPEDEMWRIGHRLVEERQISLNGAVVLPYRDNVGQENQEPSEHVFRFTVPNSSTPGGEWIDVFSPRNNTERREFRVVRIADKNSSVLEEQTVVMLHAPIFGFDSGDLASLDAVLTEMGAGEQIAPPSSALELDGPPGPLDPPTN